MTDWTRSVGTNGTMMIRDTGTRVEFWLKAGSATFNYTLPWGYTVNGVTDNSNSFRFEKGGNWQMLKSWAVSTSQTVAFRLGDTGTAGLDGPANFGHDIDRSTIPGPPSAPVVTNVGARTATTTFTDGSNGGASINDVRHGWSLSATGAPTRTITPSTRTYTWISLEPGTKYYFRGACHNVNGWGPWGPATAATTDTEPDAPGMVTVSEITQTTLKASFVDSPDTGGSTILERQLGYSQSSSGNPTTTLNYAGPMTVQNLIPGTTYYFRSRSRNAVGWSDWSAPRTARTIAGAFVKVGGVWKPAVPYVKYNGVWKPARPWGRLFGFWQESK